MISTITSFIPFSFNRLKILTGFASLGFIKMASIASRTRARSSATTLSEATQNDEGQTRSTTKRSKCAKSSQAQTTREEEEPKPVGVEEDAQILVKPGPEASLPKTSQAQPHRPTLTVQVTLTEGSKAEIPDPVSFSASTTIGKLTTSNNKPAEPKPSPDAQKESDSLSATKNTTTTNMTNAHVTSSDNVNERELAKSVFGIYQSVSYGTSQPKGRPKSGRKWKTEQTSR